MYDSFMGYIVNVTSSRTGNKWQHGNWIFFCFWFHFHIIHPDLGPHMEHGSCVVGVAFDIFGLNICLFGSINNLNLHFHVREWQIL